MGAGSSFITTYCNNISNVSLTSESLSALGYKKVLCNNNNPDKQIYTHEQQKRWYCLRKLKAYSYQQEQNLIQLVQRLQNKKSLYLSNIILSECHSYRANIIQKSNLHCQVRVFSEFSSYSLTSLITKQLKQYQIQNQFNNLCKQENQLDIKQLIWTNFQLANFFYYLVGIIHQLVTFGVNINNLIIENIFILNKTQIKLDIFEQVTRRTYKNQQERLNQLAFQMGIILIQIILVQKQIKLFDQKNGQLCQSQFQIKLGKVFLLLQKNLSYCQIQEGSQTFQIKFIQVLQYIFSRDTSNNINISFLKQKAQQLLKIVSNTIIIPAKINNSLSISSQNKLKHTNSTQYAQNNSYSKIQICQTSKQKRNKRNLCKQNKQNSNNKQNIKNGENLSNQLINQQNILQGYNLIRLQNKIIQGYYKDNKLHGLALIHQQSGLTTQYIYNNNIAIQQIPYKQ